MNVQIQSVKFDADKRLVEFVENKMDKLDRFAERSTGAEVILRLDKDFEKGNKIATVTLHMPGEDLVACHQSRSFEESVDEAIECILSAKTVCCFGAGNSYVPALELHNRLMKMGIYSQCERDAHLQNILISSCGSEDVMVLFSISGGTKDVVDAAALARTCGMRIIVVTSHDKSPLTRFADVVLSSVPTESPTEAGAMASKIIQLFLVDILCTGIYFKDKKKYGDCIAKSNAAVVGKLI